MIAILGPGAVGGLIAALLEQVHLDVKVVARPLTAHQIEQHGLTVTSAMFGPITAQLETTVRLESDVDVLVVATKAAGLKAALERITVPPALVVPVLNGLDHMPLLRARFGANVLAGVIYVESDQPAPAAIVHSSAFIRIELARAPDHLEQRAAALARRLRSAGIDVATCGSETQVLWTKLVRLNALALTTSASGLLLGNIREDPFWRRRLERAVAEAVEVAQAEGALIVPTHALDDLDRYDARLGSSMARDIAAGREPELDAIAGAVLRSADRHGIAVPTIEWLVDAVSHVLAVQART